MISALASVASCVVLAQAARPTLSGPELRAATAGGHFLMHYTLSGDDAVLPLDLEPANGLPDLVDDFATGLEAMWGRATAAGWTAPPGDDGSGGDGRLDVYVRAIPAQGQAHAEAAPGGVSTWIELAPRVGGFGRVAARAIAAHQAHHAFQLALAGAALDPWIYEATATWEELSLYDQPELQSTRDTLWSVRLAGAARPIAEVGGSFPDAGMTWLKFLADRAGGEAMIAKLWREMARAGDVRAGHEAALAGAFAGGLRDAFAHYALWNQFACQRDDGHHYALGLACGVPATVPERVAPGYPSGEQVGAAVGALGAMYLVLFPACDREKATVHLDLGAETEWRIARLLEWSGRSEEMLEPLAGSQHDTVVPFAGLQRGVVVVANVGTQDGRFGWHTAADGSYQPPADPGPPTSIYLDPVPSTLIAGQTKAVKVRARYGTCDNGTDWTAQAVYTSSQQKVATFEGGLIRAHAAGATHLGASAGGKQTFVTLVVGAAPEGGCRVARDGGVPGTLAVMALLAALTRAVSSRSSRAADRARRRACARVSAKGKPGGRWA